MCPPRFPMHPRQQQFRVHLRDGRSVTARPAMISPRHIPRMRHQPGRHQAPCCRRPASPICATSGHQQRNIRRQPQQRGARRRPEQQCWGDPRSSGAHRSTERTVPGHARSTCHIPSLNHQHGSSSPVALEIIKVSIQVLRVLIQSIVTMEVYSQWIHLFRHF
jgi:hypothetical protein